MSDADTGESVFQAQEDVAGDYGTFSPVTYAHLTLPTNIAVAASAVPVYRNKDPAVFTVPMPYVTYSFAHVPIPRHNYLHLVAGYAG